jgi:transcriptional regulator with XRE-family HTH domain
MTNLSKILKLYIRMNDIDQKDLAADIGVSESSMSKLLSGRSGLELRNMMSVMTWLARGEKS